MVCICEHSLVYQQIECDFVGTFNTQHLNSQFHACEFNFVVVVVVDVAVLVDFFRFVVFFPFVLLFHSIFVCIFVCREDSDCICRSTKHISFELPFPFWSAKNCQHWNCASPRKIQQKFSKNWSSVNEMNTTLTVLLIKLCVENLSHSARQTITTTNNIYINIYALMATWNDWMCDNVIEIHVYTTTAPAKLDIPMISK